MALTREGIATIKNKVAFFKSLADGSATNDAGGNLEANVNMSFNEMAQSADYAAWVSGTEYGAKFEENLQKLKDVSTQLRAQYLEVCNKMESYIQVQESINAGGED